MGSLTKRECAWLLSSIENNFEKKEINNEEFDPGSGRTLAACLTHASLGERCSSERLVNRRTGE